MQTVREIGRLRQTSLPHAPYVVFHRVTTCWDEPLVRFRLSDERFAPQARHIPRAAEDKRSSHAGGRVKCVGVGLAYFYVIRSNHDIPEVLVDANVISPRA